eukprot:4550097-Prymnesium_polylepis.1
MRARTTGGRRWPLRRGPPTATCPTAATAPRVPRRRHPCAWQSVSRGCRSNTAQSGSSRSEGCRT